MSDVSRLERFNTAGTAKCPSTACVICGGGPDSRSAISPTAGGLALLVADISVELTGLSSVNCVPGKLESRLTLEEPALGVLVPDSPSSRSSVFTRPTE